MIHVFTSSRYKVQKKDIISHAEEYLQKRRYQSEGFINIIFVGKRRMTQVALQYLNKNIAKPVLSFKFGPEQETFGEVFLCYPQVVLLAAEKNKTVDGMITHLVEHGIDNLFTL
jgi:ssRNA-specific RNase YbeY (16S rRNA maturation enzyme)